MPVRLPQSTTLRSATLALVFALAACNGNDSPLSPDTVEPAGPGGAESASLTPDDAEQVSVTPELLTSPRILFMSMRTGGGDVYRMAPDGTGVTRLTSFSGPEYVPAWSRDNARIAMVRNRLDASNVVHSDIFIMNADGTNKHWARSVPSAFAMNRPSWSKDGKRLVVTAWYGGASRLALLDLASGNVSFVNTAMGGPVGYGPEFDPTGTRIVYAGNWGDTLHVINADGTGHKVVVADQRVGDAHFSPDGKKIAYAHSPSGESSEIYVKNLVDGTVKRVTNNGATDFGPTWSPDGSKIAFVSDRTGKNQVFVMPSAGGTAVRITNNTATENAPAWSH